MPVFEVCVDSVEGVGMARAAGADRVELCADLLEGGITPSIGLIGAAVAAAGPVRVHVLIRPRGGDFCYSEAEVAVMLRDIEAARAAGAHGVVIGALTPFGDVDLEVTAQLVRAGAGVAVTFHRAFDLTRDPVAALDALIELSVDRVLTSGQESRAIDGAPLIGELHRRAAGRIVVLPGGGISEGNAAALLAGTGVGELHFSAAAPRRGAGRLGAARLSFTGTPHPDPDIRNHTSGERITAIMAAASQSPP